MSEFIAMPKVGELTESVVLLTWLCAVGDRVSEGQPLAEVETDKVEIEVTSPMSGVVTRLLVETGAEVAVGAHYCEIES